MNTSLEKKSRNNNQPSEHQIIEEVTKSKDRSNVGRNNQQLSEHQIIEEVTKSKNRSSVSRNNHRSLPFLQSIEKEVTKSRNELSSSQPIMEEVKKSREVKTFRRNNIKSNNAILFPENSHNRPPRDINLFFSRPIVEEKHNNNIMNKEMKEYLKKKYNKSKIPDKSSEIQKRNMFERTLIIDPSKPPTVKQEISKLFSTTPEERKQNEEVKKRNMQNNTTQKYLENRFERSIQSRIASLQPQKREKILYPFKPPTNKNISSRQAEKENKEVVEEKRNNENRNLNQAMLNYLKKRYK